MNQEIKNAHRVVSVQKIKGLIKGWETVSMGLRGVGRHDSADIIDQCIDELAAFLLLERKEGLKNVDTSKKI